MHPTTNHNHFRTNNIGNNNMFILKLPILTKTQIEDSQWNYRKETMTINLDHFIYAYPTTIQINKIECGEKGGWTTIKGDYKVNELMLTKYTHAGAFLYTTVDIYSSIDWILHSGPGVYDLTR